MSSRNRKWKKAALSAGVLGGVTAVTLPAPAVADETQPAIEVVADELNNPRGLHVDHHGRILVAESGTGKEGCEAGKQCVGASGSVYRIDGEKQGRVLNGLPSVAAGVADPQQPISASGPVDVLPGPFGYVVLHGGGNSNEYRAGLGAEAKALGTLRHSSGHTVADLVDYETRMDPDWVLGEPDTPNEPSSVHSNAWRLAKSDKGYLVTDAAGNDLLGISPFGTTRTEAVFPGNTVNDQLSEAVPGGVVEARDGTVYVSDMGALKPGAARIWKIEPGHRPVVFAEGLTAVSDLALDGSGDLVALTLTGGYQQSGPPLPGEINVIDTDTGDVTPVETGDRLTMSSGVDVGPDDEIYVTNNSVGTGGEVLRITR